MRQQINLYQDVLKPTRLRWSSKQLASTVLICLGVMLVIDFYGYWQTWNRQQDLLLSKQQWLAKQSELKTIEIQYPRRTEDKQLQARITQLEEELKLKKKIVGVLNRDEYGNSVGFSKYLRGLADQHVPGTWLTHVVINHGGEKMSLAGSATRPELVPVLLQRLGGESVFAGKEFKTFMLSRIKKENNWINFRMNTDYAGDEKQ